MASDFIEFNVPPSNPDGTINLAAADDQYPIDINNSIIPNGWQEGADWAVLRCFPNNNFAIGIHTNGGCTATGGSNSGTSFEHNPLENALQNFHGANTRYVDLISLSPTENGTIFSPFDTVQEGVNSTPNGGLLYITPGTYNGNNGLDINKQMVILPPANGKVVINP